MSKAETLIYPNVNDYLPARYFQPGTLPNHAEYALEIAKEKKVKLTKEEEEHLDYMNKMYKYGRAYYEYHYANQDYPQCKAYKEEFDKINSVIDRVNSL